MEAIVVTIIKISRLTGNGERDGGRHAAKVAQLGSQPECARTSRHPQSNPFMLSGKQGGIDG